MVTAQEDRGSGARESTPLSVVVPTYDRPAMLAEAIESVGDQRYENLELIVVDDASPTPVEPIVEEYTPADLSWRCIRHGQNRGANAARNTGIDAANSDIIAFLDDDDLWRPEVLEMQMSTFREEGPDVGVVLVGQQFVEDGEKTATRIPNVGREATPDLITGGVAGSFSTIAVRRRYVEDAGLPDERLPAWQDREWLIRLSRHCQFATIERPLVIRRVGAYEQISDSFEQKRDVTYPLFLEKHGDLAAELGLGRRFEATLSQHVANAALNSEHYRDARRFATKAIATDPKLTLPYAYLVVALGGRYARNAAVRLKRALD